MTETPTMDKPTVYIHSESSDDEEEEYTIFNESYNNDHDYFGGPTSSINASTNENSIDEYEQEENLDNNSNSNDEMLDDASRYAVANPNHISPPPNGLAKRVVLLTSPNVVSGRIINFDSGFKIPKRSSQDAQLGETQPPEKKSKNEVSPEGSPKLKKNIFDKKRSTESAKPIKTSPQPSFDPKSIAAPVSKMKIPKKIPSAQEEQQQAALKPKIQKRELQESSSFMDAFNVSVTRIHKQRSLSTPSSTPSSQQNKTLNKASVASATPIDNSHSNDQTLNNINNSIAKDSRTSIMSESSLTQQKLPEEAISENVSQTTKSNLSEPGAKKLIKKKVLWADHCSRELVQMSFFYLEESERVIKRNAFRGGDMAKFEKLNEREMRNTIGQVTNEELNENDVSWPTNGLQSIDLPSTIIQPVINSVEKLIQQEREKNTLAMLPFKQFLPDSPGEPDQMIAEPSIIETKQIPLEDINEQEQIIQEKQKIQLQQQQQQQQQESHAQSVSSLNYPNTNIFALVNNIPDESTENLKNILKNLQNNTSTSVSNSLNNSIPLISQIPLENQTNDNQQQQQTTQRPSRWNSSWRGNSSRSHNQQQQQQQQPQSASTRFNRPQQQGGYHQNRSQHSRDFNNRSGSYYRGNSNGSSSSNSNNNFNSRQNHSRFNDNNNNYRNSSKYDDESKPKAQGKWI